jgi:hypothetical protein
MPIHIQRRLFPDQALALLALEGFQQNDPSGPGVTVTAEVRAIDGAAWLYVTSEGPTVTPDALVLPGYELVLP